MGFFSDIKDKIFGRHEETVTQTAQADLRPAPTQADMSPAPTPTATPTSAAPQPAAPSASPAPTQGAAPASPVTTASSVDVAAILDEAAAKSGQTLDWRKSIVDLMKALDIDSSLASRKELAGELNYTGDTNDSATMNVWLHKQVLQKLSENGGKVPAELL